MDIEVNGPIGREVLSELDHRIMASNAPRSTGKPPRFWRPGSPGRPTRFPRLEYCQSAPGLWRILDTDPCGDGRRMEVGPHYRTRAELLADLERYAKFYGCL